MNEKNAKKFLFSVPAWVLLILFVPVFLLIVFVGNNLDYSDYKELALIPNYYLFGIALIVLILFFLIDRLLERIPDNRITYIGVIILSLIVSIAVYKIKIFIAENVAFLGGWDSGIVANSAKWMYGGLNITQCYEEYFLICEFNVPVTWLMYRLYKFAVTLREYPYYPEFIWTQFETILYAGSVFLSAMSALIMTKRVKHTVYALVAATAILGLSLWNIVPYTDGVSIIYPVAAFFFYCAFRQSRSAWRYLFWYMCCALALLGMLFKATALIVLLAVVLTELLGFIFNKEKNGKAFIICALLLAGGLFTAGLARQGMYANVDYVPDKGYHESWSAVLVTGINAETGGGVYANGYKSMYEYKDRPRIERTIADLKVVGSRIKDMGVVGTLWFFTKKSVMNFNDGTFSWYKEGAFDYYDYPILYYNRFTGFLNSFYREGEKYYPLFANLSQILWLIIEFGVIVEAVLFLKRIRMPNTSRADGVMERMVLVTTMLGIYIYIMLFEGRARYLIVNSAVIILLGIIGIVDLYTFINKRMREKGKSEENL